MMSRQIRYMRSTLDIIICVLLIVFVILVSLGNFSTTQPLKDVVLKFNNITLNPTPTSVHFSQVPTSIKYDLTTFQKGCAISDIQYFFMCGIQQTCSGILYSISDKSFTLNIRTQKQTCRFSGFIRFVNAGQLL